MPDKPLIDQLRALLPEPNEQLSAALDKVAQLEHEHSAAVEQARIERAFLLRAPREGLLYPGDALKLDDIVPKIREAGENEQALEDVFNTLRSSRPYLFAKPPASPANQKLSEPEQPRGLRHGSLTRQVQEIRRRRR
ncbi:MAG: hypothetical protein H6839_15835 [Planctomycetes bacterium]|nr:hypothetical protein [Planctomycetota bacterium]